MILHGVAHSLRAMGRLAEARPLYQRALAAHVGAKLWGIASAISIQITEVELFTGNFPAALASADLGAEQARLGHDPVNERTNIAHKGRTLFFQGRPEETKAEFERSQALGLFDGPAEHYNSLTAAVLYPGIGLLETTNISVGRGTDRPFEVLGAPWLDGAALARALNEAQLPGVRFVPLRFTPESSKFAGEECGGINILVTDRGALRPGPDRRQLLPDLRDHQSVR